jgi:hypothetical protein
MREIANNGNTRAIDTMDLLPQTWASQQQAE